MTHINTALANPPSSGPDDCRATSTPIVQTATFAHDPFAPGDYDYSRSGNPTRTALETQLARLDDATHAFAFASGVSAIAATLALAPRGSDVIVGDDLYGGTQRLLRLAAADRSLRIIPAPLHLPDALRKAVTARTSLVLAESVTNPSMREADVAALARITRARGITLAIDNTMLTPLIQRPLDLGADVAIQSATKLLGGHADLTAGVLATNDHAIAQSVAHRRNAEGTALAPFEAWLLIRGLQTLALRLERQRDNTRAILHALREHPAVLEVLYPPSGRGSCVASFRLPSPDAAQRLIQSVRRFHIAVSFGSVASSISLPARMSHASATPEERERQKIDDALVRISVGVECADDLIADLTRALDATHPPASSSSASSSATFRITAAD